MPGHEPVIYPDASHGYALRMSQVPDRAAAESIDHDANVGAGHTTRGCKRSSARVVLGAGGVAAPHDHAADPGASRDVQSSKEPAS